MYALIDKAIELFQNEINNIDFDGSNVESVANFYHKFGAEDLTYFQNKNIDQIPLVNKMINKIL